MSSLTPGDVYVRAVSLSLTPGVVGSATTPKIANKLNRTFTTSINLSPNADRSIVTPKTARIT